MNDISDGNNTFFTNYAGGVRSHPCGACKYLRRKCMPDCVFAPHFSSDEGADEFSSIHKIFGASNASKLLSLVPENRRQEAVNSMLFEAQARVKDPVYGCVSVIVALQQEVTNLQAQISHLKSQKGVINHPNLSTTRTMTQHPDLTLHLYTPHTLEDGSSSRSQPVPAWNQLAVDNRQDKGKQVQKSQDDTECAKSTLKDILSLSFPVIVQRENEVISAVKTLTNSSNLSFDQRITMIKLKSELSRLVNEYQLAESKFNYHDHKIRKRDSEVASITMMEHAQETSKLKEAELVKENEKIVLEIEQLNAKMKKNQELIENMAIVRNEEAPAITRLKASLEATSSEVEHWLMAKGMAERKMKEASKKWNTYGFFI